MFWALTCVARLVVALLTPLGFKPSSTKVGLERLIGLCEMGHSGYFLALWLGCWLHGRVKPAHMLRSVNCADQAEFRVKKTRKRSSLSLHLRRREIIQIDKSSIQSESKLKLSKISQRNSKSRTKGTPEQERGREGELPA
jgi:hypothetical protein